MKSLVNQMNREMHRDLTPIVSHKLGDKFRESIESGVVCKLDLSSVAFGASLMVNPTKVEERRLRDMDGFFHDQEAYNGADKQELVYRTYYFNFDGMSCAITDMFPGSIGNEFYLTKGHFHEPPGMSEVYIFLRGHGVSVMQHRSKKKPVLIAPLMQGTVVFSPPFYAHRTVNIGRDVLSWISIFNTKARLDYEPIVKEGFRALIIEKDGRATFTMNTSHI